MKRLSRVVWSEGMHLAQHHFQAQARYFEESIRFALADLLFKPYGLLALELDQDALRNGVAALIQARGVMPDGLPFHFPDGDPLPEPTDVRPEFSPTQNSHLLTLTIPALRVGAPNCTWGETPSLGDVRFVREERPLVDETTGDDTHPVELARKNFRLRLDRDAPPGEDEGEGRDEEGSADIRGTEPRGAAGNGGREAVVSLPLARIRRDGSGRFAYDPHYVPPCLSIIASPRILEILSGLVNLLRVKGDTLSATRADGRRSLAEYSSKEVASFWLLHAIQSALSPLEHHLVVGRTHPEVVYRELVRLAGALCTFSLTSDPASMPVYDHEALERTFDALDQHIRTHLEVTLPTACLTFALERHKKYIFLHMADVGDPRVFGPSEWILGIRSSLGRGKLIKEVPDLVKASSQDEIAARVKRGTGGVALEHLPSPPSVLSPRIGTLYFRMARSGPDWDSIRETRKVAVYVPEAITEPEVELLVVLGS